MVILFLVAVLLTVDIFLRLAAVYRPLEAEDWSSPGRSLRDAAGAIDIPADRSGAWRSKRESNPLTPAGFGPG